MINQNSSTQNSPERFYLEAGAGAPVVLLHCSAGSSRSFLPLIEDLSADFHVYAPDLLGYGGNWAWPRDARLEPDMEVAALEPFFASAGEAVHLVGHSYGGTVAINAAKRFAGNIASLTLIEPVAFHLLRYSGQHQLRSEIAALAERYLELSNACRDEEAAETFIDYWSGTGAWQKLPASLRSSIVRTAPKVAAEWRLLGCAPDDHDEIAQISAPTLLVSGSRTRETALGVIDVLKALLPKASHVEIASAGHMSPQTHVDAVGRAIRAHFAATESRQLETASPAHARNAR
jgi:pimeloyl-ACP methyl ester carboxylesterase